MIHENFLELEAKTEVFLKRQIKEKYEKKFERTMEEMAEQIFNLTNEIDGLNRRCSCLRGGEDNAMIIHCGFVVLALKISFPGT